MNQQSENSSLCIIQVNSYKNQYYAVFDKNHKVLHKKQPLLMWLEKHIIYLMGVLFQMDIILRQSLLL